MSTRTSILTASFATSAVWLLVGCGSTHFTKAVGRDTAPVARQAYAYGRFTLAGEKTLIPNDHHSVALHFKCSDGSTFTAGFLHGDDALQIIPVPAATCSLKEFYFTRAFGTFNAKPYTGELLQNVAFGPGQMHYLGDFTGAVTVQATYPTTTTRWQFNDVANHYGATTEAVRAKAPSFKNVASVNALEVAFAAQKNATAATAAR